MGSRVDAGDRSACVMATKRRITLWQGGQLPTLSPGGAITCFGSERGNPKFSPQDRRTTRLDCRAAGTTKSV
jgi:hypothetical protein